MPTSLVTAVVCRTGKIINNDLDIFKRGDNLLQNGIALCVLGSAAIIRNYVYVDEKLTFLKEPWHLIGL